MDVATWRSKAFAWGKIPLKQRLFLSHFILSAVIAVFSSLVSLFPELTGMPERNGDRELKMELFHISRNAVNRFGGASVQAIALSGELSRGITRTLDDMGQDFGDLPVSPDIIEEILSREVSGLLAALDRTGCTGVFMVLDVTANSGLPEAGDFKAGVYIRNAEPAIPGGEGPRLCLRGIPEVIAKNGLERHTRWDREFNVAGRLFYNEPLQKYRTNPALPLSLLCFWTGQGAVPDSDDTALLCSVPMVGEDGQVLGVCGFEISAMNFGLACAPSPDLYPHVMSLIAPLEGDKLHLEYSLTAGNYRPQRTVASIKRYKDGLMLYKGEGQSLAGIQEELDLYPPNSPFAGSRFVVAVMVPQRELEALAGRTIWRILIPGALLAASLAAAFVLRRQYVRSLAESLRSLEQGKVGEKTNIPEIDRLLDVVTDKIKAAGNQEEPADVPVEKPAEESGEEEAGKKDITTIEDFFDDFLKRRKTLTPVERKIFDYYAQGLSRKEIMEKRPMSNGTFNSHSAHIFAKVGVRSKEEIALYMELVRRTGKTELPEL